MLSRLKNGRLRFNDGIWCRKNGLVDRRRVEHDYKEAERDDDWRDRRDKELWF